MLEDKNQDTIDLLLFHQKSARRGKNVQPNMQKRVHKNVENQHYHQNKTKSQNRTRRQLSAGKKKRQKEEGWFFKKPKHMLQKHGEKRVGAHSKKGLNRVVEKDAMASPGIDYRGRQPMKPRTYLVSFCDRLINVLYVTGNAVKR